MDKTEEAIEIRCPFEKVICREEFSRFYSLGVPSRTLLIKSGGGKASILPSANLLLALRRYGEAASIIGYPAATSEWRDDEPLLDHRLMFG